MDAQTETARGGRWRVVRDEQGNGAHWRGPFYLERLTATSGWQTEGQTKTPRALLTIIHDCRAAVGDERMSAAEFADLMDAAHHWSNADRGSNSKATTIQLRVTGDEKATIEARAKALGLSLSGYLRQLAMRDAR